MLTPSRPLIHPHTHTRTPSKPPPPPLPLLQSLLSATAVLKLNGGLGTSMGLEKAKSLLVVKDGKTFLDLICEQVGEGGRQGGWVNGLLSPMPEGEPGQGG